MIANPHDIKRWQSRCIEVGFTICWMRSIYSHKVDFSGMEVTTQYRDEYFTFLVPHLVFEELPDIAIVSYLEMIRMQMSDTTNGIVHAITEADFDKLKEELV